MRNMTAITLAGLFCMTGASAASAADLKELAEQLVNKKAQSQMPGRKTAVGGLAVEGKGTTGSGQASSGRIAIGDPGVKQGSKKPQTQRSGGAHPAVGTQTPQKADAKKALDAFQDARVKRPGRSTYGNAVPDQASDEAQARAIREGGRTVGAGQR